MMFARLFVVFVLFLWKARATELNSRNPYWAQSNGDITPFLQNSALVKQEIDCVLNKGYCDELGKTIKLAIPEIIFRNCISCTPQQAANARKVIRVVNQRFPGVMGRILRLYHSLKPHTKSSKDQTKIEADQ